MEESFKNFKSNISDRVLGIEGKLELKEKNATSFKNKTIKKIEENKGRINNLVNFENVTKRLDDDIESLGQRINKNNE